MSEARYVYRKITTTESDAKVCAEMIREYSWGVEYPVDPWDELRQADYIAGCFSGEYLVGCASITRVASPDGIGNDVPWFANVVVLPEYRKQGIMKKLYENCLEYCRATSEKKILTCTNNPVMEKFFENQGWQLDRITKDESGGECNVFVYRI